MYLPPRVTARVLNDELLGEDPDNERIREVVESLEAREWTIEHIYDRLSREHLANDELVECLNNIQAEQEAAACKE